MPFAFNHELWNIGRQIEDTTLPHLNKHYDCDFKRNENDVFDILDFKDDENKKIVEVKGRRCSSTQYKETIITASKITAGLQAIESDYRVFFVFVFTDKTMEYELCENDSFKCRITGTNSILHYLIPVEDLKEIIIKEE
tara:strand:+ start:73 stop:489 length:417 start_codon:yes stop_codon:yes gene_type:complete